MNEYPLKFNNLINICKSFGILCHKAFYNMISIPSESKNNKINLLKSRLADMLNEFINSSENIMSYEYDYMLDGSNHMICNIASAAIVIIQRNDLLIYDIFSDVCYYTYQNQLYVNNSLHIVRPSEHKFRGNLQCEALQLVYYYMGYINKPTFTNMKLTQFINLLNN